MADDLILTADAKQAIAELERLNKKLKETGEAAEKGFDRSGAASGRARDEFGRFVSTGTKGSKALGASIGALTSPLGLATIGVGALSAAFIELARQATMAFIDITKEGVRLNEEAELVRLSLVQIFEGNEAAADAFIDTVGELAIKLGTSRQELTGLAKGILPDVGGIQATADLLENVIVLGRDAGQGIDSIRIATEEALSGNLSSLGRRLNIPRATIARIKEYQKEMSLADAINRGLAERIEQTGISADVTADSFATLQGRLRGNVENFQRILGESPFEELKEQAQGFLQAIEENEDEIGFVADAFGDLAANVIDFVGSGLQEFIASIDFEAVERLVDAFNLALAAGQLVVDVLFEIPDTIDGINQTTAALLETQKMLVSVAETAARVKIGLQAAFLSAKALFQIESGDFIGAIESITALGPLSSLENQEQVAQNTADAFDRYGRTVEAITAAQDERRNSTKESTQADIDAGEAALANKKALEELADAQKAAAEAQEEIGEKTAKAEADRQKRLTALIRKESEKRFDDAVKAAQRREDIARDNAQAIEDIFRNLNQDISAAATDLSRDEADIARRGSRDRQSIERDAANARLDIERNFRQELQRIQLQFNQSAAEAERNNDAQAFLRAVRARDEQVQVATSERDVSLEDASRRAQEQRQSLKEQLAAEVEDARIANARKLADLQLRLEQELEAQAIKIARELEAEAIRDQRLRERRDLELQREVEAFQRKEEEIRARLNESLNEQLAIIDAAKTKEIEITAAAEAEKTRIVQEEAARRAAIQAISPAQARQAEQENFPGFQAGGRPPVGSPVVVGERGPEVFVPDAAGTIIPNRAMFSPPAAGVPMPMGSSSVTNNSPTFNLAESMFRDPIARRNLTNFILMVQAEGG